MYEFNQRRVIQINVMTHHDRKIEKSCFVQMPEIEAAMHKYVSSNPARKNSVFLDFPPMFVCK